MQCLTITTEKIQYLSSLIEDAETSPRDYKNVSESLYGEYLLKTQKMVDCEADVLLSVED